MLGRRQLLPRSRSSSRLYSPVRSASLFLLCLLRLGHQPWACGCAPWRARVCRVPRRARPHAPARACGAMGMAGRGLRRERPWAGPDLGSSSRCAGCAGRLRGPGIAALRLLVPAGLSPLDFALLPASSVWRRISLPKSLTISPDGHLQAGCGGACL